MRCYFNLLLSVSLYLQFGCFLGRLLRKQTALSTFFYEAQFSGLALGKQLTGGAGAIGA
jgi:hypothetical protein